MFIVPIILLGVLIGVVISANSMKKKGTMTESRYQMIISVASIIVTIAALTLMFSRMRGK